jgi:hypothetical protein
MITGTSSLLDGSKILADCIARIISVSQYQLEVDEATHKHIRDAFTHGQLGSKLAAVQHLSSLQNLRALIIGQWHGMLPRLLYKYGIVRSCIGIEIDPLWAEFSNRINNDWNYKSIVGDGTDPSLWSTYNVDIVINTSCEHMNWDWLDFEANHEMYVYAQSSNYVHDEHINRLDNIDQMTEVFNHRGFDIEFKKIEKFEVYDRYCVLAKK